MTTVSSVTSSTSGSTASSSASGSASTVDYNSFLQLLVQELKNQDPTSPSDPTQYLSQIATFSNVEQGVNMNNKLGTLLTTSALTQAEAAMGQTVTSGTASGVITSVSLDSSGSPLATLSNGSKVSLGSSVTFGPTTTTASSATTS